MRQAMTYDVYQTVADRHLIKPFACVTKVGAKRFIQELTGEQVAIGLEPGDCVTVAVVDGNELLLVRNAYGSNLYHFNWLNSWFYHSKGARYE